MSECEMCGRPALECGHYPAQEIADLRAKLEQARREYEGPMAEEIEALKARLDFCAAVKIERDQAQARARRLEAALRLAQDAMRAPLDDWKGVLERKALGAARAALAEAPEPDPGCAPEPDPDAENDFRRENPREDD